MKTRWTLSCSCLAWMVSLDTNDHERIFNSLILVQNEQTLLCSRKDVQPLQKYRYIFPLYGKGRVSLLIYGVSRFASKRLVWRSALALFVRLRRTVMLQHFVYYSVLPRCSVLPFLLVWNDGRNGCWHGDLPTYFSMEADRGLSSAMSRNGDSRFTVGEPRCQLTLLMTSFSAVTHPLLECSIFLSLMRASDNVINRCQ